MPILVADWKLWACAALAALAVAAHPATDHSRESVAITSVTVIDVVTGAKRTGVTVLTQGDRITALGPKVAIPRGTSRLDGKGKFLIPGLWDMHTHHQGTGADCLDLFIAKGVVGTRDMGGDAGFILPLRERVNSGAVLGPEIVAAGPILDDAPPGFPYRRRVTNAQAGQGSGGRPEAAGVDFIKVHDHTPREVFFADCRGGAESWGSPSPDTFLKGVKVEEAADAGIRSIEHLSNYDVFGECLVNDEYTRLPAAGACLKNWPRKMFGRHPRWRSFRRFPTCSPARRWNTPSMPATPFETRRAITWRTPTCLRAPWKRCGWQGKSACRAIHDMQLDWQPLSGRMRWAGAGFLPSR